MDDEIRNLILDVTEASLEAQLRAVRRLRGSGSPTKAEPKKSMSNLDMVYDVLRDSHENALHVSAIIERVKDRFGVDLDRESLVSSLSKKVARKDRFTRTGRNVFAAIEE
jgi:hypothetical protein